MPDEIKNDRYFAEGFRELDESLAETTAMLADSLPLNDKLRSLIPWQVDREFPAEVPAGSEREGAQVLSICFEILNIVEERRRRPQRRRSHRHPQKSAS